MSEPWRERVEVGDAVLMLGDCRSILPTLGPADAAIIDPPYGNGYYKTDVALPIGPLIRMWPSVAVFGFPEDLAKLCSESGATPTEWIVWYPPNKRVRSKGLTRACEHIAVFGAIDGVASVTKPRVDDAWASRIAAMRGLSADFARANDVWEDPAPGAANNAHLRQHPNEKPVEVVSKLVNLCTAEIGAVVVDPTMGSGTTGVACANLGRRFIGIELDPKHFATAVRRITEAQRQGRLFDPPRQRAEQLALLP